MDNVLLSCSNLIKEYGEVIKTRALNDVSLTLYEAEFSSIIGASGCGKSTLLNLIGALDRPTGGSLKFRSQDYLAMNERELAAFRNKNMVSYFNFTICFLNLRLLKML